jgi:hypothetical protein
MLVTVAKPTYTHTAGPATGEFGSHGLLSTTRRSLAC